MIPHINNIWYVEHIRNLGEKKKRNHTINY